jgi:hypothetical protein
MQSYKNVMKYGAQHSKHGDNKSPPLCTTLWCPSLQHYTNGVHVSAYYAQLRYWQIFNKQMRIPLHPEPGKTVNN